MQTEIIAKASGTTTTTTANVITLDAPSVVRLDLDRAQVAAMERQGNDLIIRLADGQTIRIDNFYNEQRGTISDLVLRDDQGGQWLAHPAASGAGRFTALTSLDDLLAAQGAAQGGGASFILPAVLGVAGVGGLVAAVSGGGGDDDRAPATPPTADTQAPARPTAIFNPAGTGVTGTGEAGATVRVTDPTGTVIGTGTVGADGNYAVTLNPPQTNGQPVTVTQSDPAGNVSPGASVTAPDITPPTAPTATVNGQGTTITGTGEPGATVTVRDAAGNVLGTATVDAQGNYTLTLTTPQANGGTLTVTQADAAGNVSSAATLTAPDITPPAAPTATLGQNGTTVTGTGEPGATVSVRDAAGQVIGTATVDAQGNYTLTLTSPQANGGTLTVTQADAAGNVSPAATLTVPDTTAPAAPTATLGQNGDTVTGTGEPGATVSVRDAAGQVIGTATVDAQGNYTLTLTTPQANGGTLTVTQADAAGNVSPAATLTVSDTTAPAAPTATLGQNGDTVTGTGEPGATVSVRDAAGQVIGTATVDAQGNYTLTLTTPQTNGETLTVTQADAAGNVSAAASLTAPDTSAPGAPVVAVSADGTVLTGTGEPGATVRVTDADGLPIGTAIVGADGGFSVTLPTGTADGRTLSATQTDAAGNVSAAVTTVTPDLAAPDAPSVALSPEGTVVTGTGEAGAIVEIRDADGTLIATAPVAADGSFSVTLPTPQANGEMLMVTQTDAAGNISPPMMTVAPDITPPDAPGVTLSGDGAAVYGNGEPGATVRIVDSNGNLLGSAVVAADTSFVVSLATPQTGGQVLTATQTDAAGNVSDPSIVAAPDVTAPDAPLATIAPDGSAVIGTGEPFATVTVRGPDGTPLASAVVGADGGYSVPLAPAQANGETLTVGQTDRGGNSSSSVTLTAPDITAPTGLTATIDGNGIVVTGSGEPGATVTIRDAGGTAIGTAQVDANGGYSATLTTPQANGQVLSVTQADAAGNVSAPVPLTAPDITAPLAPTGSVVDAGVTLAGTGEPGATVTVRAVNGTLLGSAQVGADGSFAVPLATPQANGETVQIVQTDAAGNASPVVIVTAPDITAPTELTATVSGDGTLVTGLGEAGASVTVRDPAGIVIGTAIVGADGSYVATLTIPQRNAETLQVTQADAAGNASLSVAPIAPDLTAPAAPVATLSPEGITVGGTGEVGATVTVRAADGTVLGTVQVGADGNFAVTLTTPQVNGQTLTVTQADAAGNVSAPLALIALDTSVPVGLTAAIDATGSVVTGLAEAGATVTVRDAGGTVVATATAAANGAYTVVLAPPQIDGDTLLVTQADAAGNASAPVTVTAPDFTAPDAPLVAVNADGTLASGSGEAGATVTIRDADGTVIGSGAIGADGLFAVPLTPAQANGGTISATLSDATGNVSGATTATAPDITAPGAPLALLDPTGRIVSGTGEVGATVTVRDAGGNVLGTATVNAGGSYAVLLPVAQIDRQILSVSQADATGNISGSTSVAALDLTPPNAPAAVVAADGASLTGTGEIGAIVTITDPVGLVIATVPVGADGRFTVTLAPPLTNGQLLTLTQADAAGNVSAPGAAIAPDLVPNDTPGAPTASVALDGASVSGTGQAGATITVRDATGTVIGGATVNPDGSYSATLTTPQTNGETVRVTQADADGDVSPPAIAVAPDLTPPAAPTATIDATGSVVTGVGEVGATIRIADAGGTLLGSGVVGATGRYVVVLSTPQTDGQPLTATQADAAGNASPGVGVVAPDLTAPIAPLGTVSGDGTTVTGTGETGATVTIRDVGGTILATALVAGDGSFTATLSPAQADGQLLVLTQADPAGNVSPIAQIAAPDISAPVGLTAAIDGAGIIVTGQGEAGATVTIRDTAGTVLGTALVAANGSYAALLTTPQVNGQLLVATQVDAAGNSGAPAPVTAPDLTAPLAPVGIVAGDGTAITGTGEAGATVTIRGPGGIVLGTALVAGDGSFTATLTPPQANGQLLSLSQSDPTGNVSPIAQVSAPDITAPVGLTAAINGAGTLVSGQGEAGATVTIRDAGGTVIATAVVAPNGTYAAILATPQVNGQALSVTQADAGGNVGAAAAVTAPDLTAPLAPVGIVSGDGTTLTGTGEAGATVTIRGPGGAILGTALVAADGSFTVPLVPAQANGQLLSLSQADAAGNVSATAQATAPDITAPIGLTAAINGVGTLVTGTGEAGATVTVRDPLGTVIGTGIVAANGSYSVTLTVPQANGQVLQVTQADVAGNASLPGSVIAPDITPPAAPLATVNGTGTTVTGTGEAGATIRILDPAGQLVGTALVGADGGYSATLSTPQANGQLLSVTQTDAAGNASVRIVASAPDITPPAPPTATINPGGTVVSGLGEPGATVEVRNAAGTVIGTGTVAPGGLYAVTLPSPQLAGETLSVGLRDGAGNVSSAVSIVAPFDIGAFDNTATALVDLVPVQTNENLGSANYTALVSLGLVNLDAQVLAIPNVQFTVDAGHTLAATFTYDSLANVGVASGYSVVVQRFNGTSWVAVDGSGTSSLLEVGLLNGNLVANADLGPGQYRAFVTFDNTLGVGLLGGLSVTGVDSDFTDIAQVIPAVTNGNVITDPGAGGQIDVVSPQTVVESVTLNGVTTAVTADATIVAGLWGTLTIARDGSYTYIPDANAAVLGKVDRFTYTLLDASDNERESATLTITIGSPDVTGVPLAVNDIATAAASFVNVVETRAPVVDTSFTTPLASILSGPQTGRAVDSFTVDANSVANVTLSAVIAPGLALLPSYTITVTNAAGTVVGTNSGTGVAGIGGVLGTGLSVTMTGLPSGTYNYTVTSTNALGTGYTSSVYVAQTVTHLDQFALTGTTPVSGDLLANDAPGSDFLEIRMLSGGRFVAVGDTPLTLTGAHGTLTIDEVGQYSYQPSTTLGYSAVDPVDSFTYQIVQPDGQVATARLDVAVDINNGIAPAFPAATITALDADGMDHLALDVVPMMADIDQPAPVVAADHGDARIALSLMEGQGDLEAVLTRYLDTQQPATVTLTDDDRGSTTIATDIGPIDAAPIVDDPLGYLTVSADPEQEKLATMHIM
ncbi:BapA/Bap/LapF family large adhesin [Sphingomonas sp. NCPPB 2930]|uniref:BapA/Bap/LapF family large adhesin n=1 Tax=Sphingomonas sp. NCPPB 2930 TaxID=3162788 RepID=UPI0036D8D7F4